MVVYQRTGTGDNDMSFTPECKNSKRTYYGRNVEGVAGGIGDSRLGQSLGRYETQ